MMKKIDIPEGTKVMSQVEAQETGHAEVMLVPAKLLSEEEKLATALATTDGDLGMSLILMEPPQAMSSDLVQAKPEDVK